ncbi:ac44 [Oxyplax ochracea nucleopolyhedrovirus]|uniref:Ac44 n=1 Tax=Oxyplax ochracea nucleopolyhedrovirus TaxID=2083176 RepID=A0A2L0WU58_9ABAC|nr:ac44 [Oxyplax ochracea nucleopolyhedrovirus]AVA31187.1 ac44 [Oxyplax ochracea nucleopolyhedrovirus]
MQSEKNRALKNLTRFPLPFYDVHVNNYGGVVFTVRRYNKRIIDFAGMREKVLKKIKMDGNLPLNMRCDVKPIDVRCAICKKNFSLYAAVTYFHCGHSCLCTECDEIKNDNVCFQCKSFIFYKLKYKAY